MNPIADLVLGLNAAILLSALGWVVSGIGILCVIVLTLRELRK